MLSSIIFALNGLSYLTVALFTFYVFFSLNNKNEPAANKIGRCMGLLGCGYLSMSLLFMLWLFNALVPNNKDVLLLITALSFFTALFILYIAYKIRGNKNLIYLMLLFICTVFAAGYSINAIFLSVMVTSYLLMSVVFIDLMLSNMFSKIAGCFGIAYIIIGIMLMALQIIGTEPSKLPWFVSNALIFSVLFFIFLDVKCMGIITTKADKKTYRIISQLKINKFIRFFIFIVSTSGFILISTISIHEIGHAVVAQYYGCEYSKAVVYDIVDSPHTEIRCSQYYNDTFLTMGGLILTVIVGLIFWMTANDYTIHISSLILGFAVFISYGDFIELGFSKNLIVIVTFFSVIIIALTIIFLSKYYLSQEKATQDLPLRLNIKK